MDKMDASEVLENVIEEHENVDGELENVVEEHEFLAEERKNVVEESENVDEGCESGVIPSEDEGDASLDLTAYPRQGHHLSRV